MKKRVILFLITLLMAISSFSSTISREIEADSIVLITPSELKETNLIFAEHSKFIVENELLIEQIENLEQDVKLLQEADSIRCQQINNYEVVSQSYQSYIRTLNDKIKRKDRIVLAWQIGGVTVSVGLLLLLLLK